MRLDDTIAAISSAAGPAARMLVRLSGEEAVSIAAKTCQLTSESLIGATRQAMRVDGLTFPAWVYVFKSPRSYTGQDIVEFHIPGNTLLARLLLDALIAAGARAAGPGEFTARAYFNNRLDLAEAEGVAAMVSASNEQELSAARQLLAGELSRRLRALPMESLAETLALVEAGIDFADEGVSFLSQEEVKKRIHGIDAAIENLLRESGRFEPLTHEPTIVLVGRPNAGKSTLLNTLAGRERAVVSDISGTTRDALTVEIALQRGLVKLVDVAGLEVDTGEAAAGPHEEIARQMQQRAVQTIQQADVVVLVIEAPDGRPSFPLLREPDLVIHTKVDLSGAPRHEANGLHVSAHSGIGLSELRNVLDTLAFGERSQTATLALNARHVQCLKQARSELGLALRNIDSGAELIAADLRDALDSLGQVLGGITPDDLLGRIFSTFCIGK